MTYRLFGILLLFFSPGTLFAGEIMFEGYYRIELEGKAVGYTIQRYEFDPKTHVFESKSFLRAKFGDSIVQESTKAKATDKFRPIEYHYTSQVGDKVKGIDATFKGDIMTAVFTDGSKQARTETSKLPKGTFLSAFLPYMMLQQKLEPGLNLKYSAVAEEDGASYDGKAMVQSKEPKPGYDTLTVLNRYKNEEFISKMAIVKDAKTEKNVKGEVFSTASPTKSLTTRLMGSAALATEGQMVPNKILLSVFGSVPVGKINMVAEPGSVGGKAPADDGATKMETMDEPTPVPPATEPVPVKPPAKKKKGR